MTDWIKHTGNTCPVDPETVVEVRSRATFRTETTKAGVFGPRWLLGGKSSITHYRIITPAKPPEPEMTKTAQEHAAAMFATATKPEPDLIALRLECLKLAVSAYVSGLTVDGEPDTVQALAHSFMLYVINEKFAKRRRKS